MATIISQIEMGNVLPGSIAIASSIKGTNETFIGLVDAPSGRHRSYIKILDGRQVVNEAVCTTIGRAAGLPIPPGFLVRVRPSDIPESTILQSFGNEIVTFATKAIGYPDLRRKINAASFHFRQKFLSSWPEWDSAMVFDEWVANIDRNEGNLLVGGSGDVWLIDHSHAFTGHTWKPADLIPNKLYKNMLAMFQIPNLTLPERYAVKIKTAKLAIKFGGINAGAALNASAANVLLLPAEASALEIFMRDRVSVLEDLISQRVGIPNLGGVP